MKWFKSFLTGRSQQVKVGSNRSRLIMVSSVVPHGYHCSPLLFNIFINDIIECFKHCEFLMFADDLKLYRPIYSSNDQAFIRNDLDNLVKWCDHNNLQLNVNKCCFISFLKETKSAPHNITLMISHYLGLTQRFRSYFR